MDVQTRRDISRIVEEDAKLVLSANRKYAASIGTTTDDLE